MKKNIIACWITAMRLPFTSVAIVPFAVGIVWAISDGMKFSITMSILGEIAVFCICVSCHLLGEIFDQEEDRNTHIYGRSKFAGGTLMVADGHLSEWSVCIAAICSLLIAFICGVIISFYYFSFLLFGLGAFGAAAAILYSIPPFRLVKRGLGELFIGICYGWLTLVTGYATACGTFPNNSLLMCLPIAFSVFNIMLINEYPDFQADKDAGKNNLMIRIGKEWSSRIYALANFIIIFSFVAICLTLHPYSYMHFLVLIPVTFLAVILSSRLLLLKKWKDVKALEKLCGLTIVLNHICSITLAILILWR